MKCPKCGYLGFERADRCRNCGYDFSLGTAPTLDPELSLRDAGRMFHAEGDLDLVDPADSSPPDGALSGDARLRGSTVTPAGDLGELPLFGLPGIDDAPDDVPLITQASRPRPPLAVRRATPEVPRLRAEPSRTPHLEFAEADAGAPFEAAVRAPVRPRRDDWAIPVAEKLPAEAAGLGARLLAGVIDLGLLGLVDAAVVYFTIQICGLSSDELSLLPLGPLIAFLVVQNGSYLVAFTAGGQTIGKMALGLRVVPAVPGTKLDLGRSLIRTGVWSLLLLPAGLGLLTALWSDERRGLHDRCAGTKVVRATAS
jgi:uncharacterized RDD family membrane protein YckC